MKNPLYVQVIKPTELVINRKKVKLIAGEIYPVAENGIINKGDDWIAEYHSDFANEHFKEHAINQTESEIRTEITTLSEDIQAEINHAECFYDNDMMNEFCEMVDKLKTLGREYQALQAKNESE